MPPNTELIEEGPLVEKNAIECKNGTMQNSDSTAVLVTASACSDVFISPWDLSTQEASSKTGSIDDMRLWTEVGKDNRAVLPVAPNERDEASMGRVVDRVRRHDKVLEIRQCGPLVRVVEQDRNPLCQKQSNTVPGLLKWYEQVLAATQDRPEEESEDHAYDGIFIGEGDVAKQVEITYQRVLAAERAIPVSKDGIVDPPSGVDSSLGLLQAEGLCCCGSSFVCTIPVADLARAMTTGQSNGLTVNGSGVLMFQSPCPAVHCVNLRQYITATSVGMGLSNALRLIKLIREEPRRAVNLRKWAPGKEGIARKQAEVSPLAKVTLTPQECEFIVGSAKVDAFTKAGGLQKNATGEETVWREQCDKLSYEYAVYTIVLGVCVAAGCADQAAKTLKSYARPVRKQMLHKLRMLPDTWVSAISKDFGTDACADSECIICRRVFCDDPTDLATHIARCDLYCRGHLWVDQGAQTWIYRLMSTAAFWDVLSSKNEQGLRNARICLRRLIADTALLGGESAGETAVKLKCLYNVSTYIGRRRMTELLHRDGPLYARMPLKSGIDVRTVIACRAYEGMTGPYANDMAVRNACSRCAIWVMFMGTLGVVAHDGFDFQNDVLSGEPMNIYRHVAGSGGATELLAFAEGAQTIMGLMCSAQVLDQLCCADVVCAALSGSISWYFVTGRYQTAANCAIVCVDTKPMAQTTAGLSRALELLSAPEAICSVLKSVSLSAAVNPVPRSRWGCYRREGYTPGVEDGRWIHHEMLMRACTGGDLTTDDALEALDAEALAAHLTLEKNRPRCARGKRDRECVCCDMAWENVTLCCTTGLVERHIQFTLACGDQERTSPLDN